MIHEPLTKLQCSPTSDGAGCAIIASERFVDEHDLWDRAVEIAGQAMATDFPSTFDGQQLDASRSSASTCRKAAADQAPTRRPRSGPTDVEVIELHDCFSPTS